jgi:hypothetical protein
MLYATALEAGCTGDRACKGGSNPGWGPKSVVMPKGMIKHLWSSSLEKGLRGELPVTPQVSVAPGRYRNCGVYSDPQLSLRCRSVALGTGVAAHLHRSARCLSALIFRLLLKTTVDNRAHRARIFFGTRYG